MPANDMKTNILTYVKSATQLHAVPVMVLIRLELFKF